MSRSVWETEDYELFKRLSPEKKVLFCLDSIDSPKDETMRALLCNAKFTVSALIVAKDSKKSLDTVKHILRNL
jgi:hypothetical protein